MGSQPDYSQPPLQVSFAGFLWDMDGTIIDSTPAIEKHWHTYVAARQPVPRAAACVGLAARLTCSAG